MIARVALVPGRPEPALTTMKNGAAESITNVEPIYEDLPGWSESTVGVQAFDKLPQKAQSYILRMEALCEVPADVVSTGPDRVETIVRRHPYE